MPTITKAATGTDLSAGASWTGGVVPGSILGQSDVASWTSTSLGPSLTGNLGATQPVGLSVTSATGNITHGTGTIYTSSSGIVFASTNTRTWTESGTINVGSNSQPWTLYNTTTNTVALDLASSGSLIGNSGTTITLTSASTNAVIFRSASTTSNFQGTLSVGSNARYFINSATVGTGVGLGSASTVRLNATTSAIGSAIANGYFISNLSINSSSSIGATGGTLAINISGATTFQSGGNYTLTCNSPVTFNASIDMSSASHTLTTAIASTIASDITLGASPISNTLSSGAGTLTISGPITFNSGSHIFTAAGTLLTISSSNTFGSGPATFTAGTGGLTISGSNNFGSGNNIFQSTAGALTISNSNNCGSGNNTFRANGAGSISITGALDCGTGNQTFQTLSGVGTLTISNNLLLNAGSHTFNSGTALITVSGVISGTNGFTKSGSNDLSITNIGGNPSLSGVVTVSAGELRLGGSAQTGNVLSGVTSYNITSTTANIITQSNTAFTFSKPIQGSGSAVFLCSNATGITLSDGVLVGLNSSSSSIGSGVYANGGASYLNINDFPTKLAYYLQGASPTGNIYYTKESPITHSGSINIDTSLAITGTGTSNFYNDNASSSNSVTISGPISQTGSGSVIFGIRGSNAGDNTISGAISGTIALIKSDSGKWILSGANTYSGSTTLSGGTLIASSQNALQNSTLIWQTAGTTFTIDSALSNATFGGLSGTSAGLTLTIPSGITLSIGNNNSTNTFANAISSPGNLTKVGTGSFIVTGSMSGFSSTATLSGGILELDSASFGAMTVSHTTVGVRASKYLMISPTVTGGYSFPAGFQLSGLGNIIITADNLTSITNGFTFPSGATSNLTGTTAGAVTGATAGLVLYSTASIANSRNLIVNLNDLPGGGSPGVLTYEFNYNLTNIALSTSAYYINSGSSHNYQTRIDVGNYSGTTGIGTGSITANLYANQATGALVLSGGINRYASAAYTATLNLRGTSVADNEISGTISQSSGTLAIGKVDSGKWILSAANTYTGNTTLSGGQLVIANSNSLQNSTLIWQTAGTTFTIDPSLGSATFGGLSGTAAGLTLTIPAGISLSVGNNNSTNTFSNEIFGSSTLTKIGTGTQTYNGSMLNFTGSANLTAGIINYDATAFGAMTINHSTVGVRASKYVAIRPTVNGGYSFPAGFTLSGSGVVFLSSNNITSITTGLTLPSGSITGLTGTAAGAATGATAGLGLQTEANVANARTLTVNLVEFPGGSNPGVLTSEFNYNLTNTVLTNNIYYNSSQETHNYPVRIDISNYSGAAAIGNGTMTTNLYANQATGALVLTGGVVRYSPTATYIATLNLRGSNSDNNEISGAITQASGILAITKSDAGTWRLTGSNSFTGAVTVSGGTLYCNNGIGGATSSLGSSAATGSITLSGGILQLDGCDSLRSSSSMVISSTSTIYALSGSNGLRLSGTTVNNGITLTTDVAADTTMLYSGTFTYGGVDTNNRFIKTGLGTLQLTSLTSTWANAGWRFDGGTIEFSSISNSGSASSFGASGDLTFRGDIILNYIGTTTSNSNRNISLGDITTPCQSFTLNSNGAGGLLNLTGSLVISSTASPISINLGGTNSNTNSAAWSIGNSSGGGVVSLNKLGSSSWILYGGLSYTGLTTSSGTGNLDFGSVNRSLSGGILINGGTITNGTNSITSNITMNGGTVNGVLSGIDKTLTISSSATEAAPATIIAADPNGINNNEYSVINGCVDIKSPESLDFTTSSGVGLILGNNVTVSSTGVIRTKGGASTSQDGHAGYNNLTLGNGSKLKIGFAA